MFNEALKYVKNNTENIYSPCVLGADVQVMAVRGCRVTS